MNDRVQQQNSADETQSFEAGAQKLIDEALETLRLSKLHYQERGAGLRLRELETTLGLLAQALSWGIDGEEVRAAAALRQAKGQPRRLQETSFFDPHVEWLYYGH